MPLALILADQHRAGLQAPLALVGRVLALTQAVEQLHGRRIEPTHGLLLDAPSHHPGEQVLGESWWRSRSESRPPQRAELVDAQRPHAFDLGFEMATADRW